MSQIRRRIILGVALLAGLGSCLPAAEQPERFAQVFIACRYRAITGCGGVWECEDSLRTRCLAEQGWKRVGGVWRLGKDARRAQELDRLHEAAGQAQPKPKVQNPAPGTSS